MIRHQKRVEARWVPVDASEKLKADLRGAGFSPDPTKKRVTLSSAGPMVWVEWTDREGERMTDQEITEHRARLVEALRGGDYIQFRGALKIDDGEAVQHCAAGVACEVYRKLTGRGTWTRLAWTENTHRSLYRFDEGNHRATHMLPDQVRAFFGFTRREEREIVRLNDWHQEDFDAIATFIEAR